MQKQVQLQVTPSEAANPAVIKKYVANAGGHAITAVTGFNILKKSIDARSSKQVWINLTLQAFIDENLWDEARIFEGERPLESGISAPIIKGTLVSEHSIKSDLLKLLIND